MSIALSSPKVDEKPEKQRFSYVPDHAERLLHTDLAEYLRWYSIGGSKAREAKRPKS